MKIVLDTNILLSSLKRTAKNRLIFDAARQGRITLAVTSEILLEYEEIIGERATLEIGRNVVRLILGLPGTEQIEVRFRFELIVVDPDDNKFVDCAIAANADLLVTNDKHFNVLHGIRFPSVQVMNDREFIELLTVKD